ncbi:M6 family metalloprotease domain-containing protein [Candidatus Poribacteria bacterium]|nr:M6 family metalloprotease domain-containing protein [Candidatus Poribacteria bacterium]
MFLNKRLYFFVVLFVLSLSFMSYAAPPHPKILLKKLTQMLKFDMSPSSSDYSAMWDSDIPKQGYEPQPDGIEYILAIRVDFSDKPGIKPSTDFDDAIFGTNGSSLRLYFEEVSYGNMTVMPGYMGGVVPGGDRWYRMSNPMTYYGSGTISTRRYKEMAVEACKAADDEVDFSKYDRDGDGYVDHFMLIHAGNDEASTGMPNDIWSAVVDNIQGVYDGVSISSAMIVAEDPSLSFINIGIYCHEFFHEFGAPDLYAYDYPVGNWCLMGTFGPYQDNGRHPAHICGYLKWDFDADRSNGITGWLNPIELNTPGTYSIDSFEHPEGQRLYKVNITGKSGREYFLIENRNRFSGLMYDTYLPESGIVIWHIDENQPKSFGYPHRAWVEDPEDPEHRSFMGATERSAYSADDNQTAFTPSTTPSSSANDGSDSGIIITDISEEGMTMNFTFFSGDTYEPNDSIAEAYGPLEYSREYTSFLTETEDIDYYKFHAEANKTTLIYLENIPEEANYDIEVYDYMERVVAYSSAPGQNPEILSFEVDSPGIYYVAVISQYGHNTKHHYSLTVDSIALAPGGVIAISKVYPNPGPGSSESIIFDYKLLEQVDTITLDIYTSTGQLIHTYTTSLNGRADKLTWDGTNDIGTRVAQGIYVYMIKADRNGESDILTGKIAVVY